MDPAALTKRIIQLVLGMATFQILGIHMGQTRILLILAVELILQEARMYHREVNSGILEIHFYLEQEVYQATFRAHGVKLQINGQSAKVILSSIVIGALRLDTAVAMQTTIEM